MQKKQIMKLLSLMLILGIGVVYLKFYKPLAADINMLSEDLDIIELEYTVRQNRIGTLGALGEQINTAEEGIKKLVPLFYNNTSQEDLIVKINSLCEDSEVRLLEIEYSGRSEFQIVETTAETTVEAPSETDFFTETITAESTQTENSPLYGDVFSVTFVADYKKIMKMLHLIDTNEKIIVNSRLEISTDVNANSYVSEELATAFPNVDFQKITLEEGALTCKIQIVFFQTENLEKYEKSENSILEEMPREKSTSENPFEKYVDEVLEGYLNE